jgi:hypothetical protein
LVALQGESQRETAAAKAELEEAREEIARLAVLHGESQWETAAAKAELNLVVLQNLQLVANQGQSQSALKVYQAALLPRPPTELKAHSACLASCPQDLQQAKGMGDKMEADDHGRGLPRSKSASDQGASLISPVQPALNTFECGFVGLVVTSSPPHRVKRVHGLLDRHCVRHDQHGHRNCAILEDDRILQVDGVNVERMDITTLQSMLCGPLHSTAVITLARHSTGEVYRIEALRHRDPSLDHSLSQGLPSISRSMAQWTMWEEAAAKEEVAAQVVAHATVTMEAEGASPTGASEHMMLSHRSLSSGSSKEVQTPRRSGSLDATLPVAQVAHALSDSFVASIFGPRPASAAALRASPGGVTLQMPCGASCRVPQDARVSTVGLLPFIHTAPQSPALHRTRSFNEMPTSGGTQNPPPMLPARPNSPKSPTLQESQEGGQPSPVTLSPNFTRMPAGVGGISPIVASPNLEQPMLISSQASLRDASSPPTQPQQANTMRMQCSAPPAQASSKITRYEFECAYAHAHLGGSRVRVCVQVCLPHSQTCEADCLPVTLSLGYVLLSSTLALPSP